MREINTDSREIQISRAEERANEQGENEATREKKVEGDGILPRGW